MIARNVCGVVMKNHLVYRNGIVYLELGFEVRDEHAQLLMDHSRWVGKCFATFSHSYHTLSATRSSTVIFGGSHHCWRGSHAGQLEIASPRFMDIMLIQHRMDPIFPYLESPCRDQILCTPLAVA